MKYKVQTCDAVKFELEDNINEIQNEMKIKQKEVQAKDDLLNSVQQEMESIIT